MQIVIDIPEEIYERFGYEYREESLISKHTNDIILDAFCNGTPLPKGHGPLKDVDEIERIWEKGNYVQSALLFAQTIVEADKEIDTPCENEICKNCSNYSEHDLCNLGHICLDGSEWCPKTE